MRFKGLLVAAALMGLMATVAKADTLLVNNALHSGTIFSYDVALSADGVLKTGDGFTIFDFAGLQSASYDATKWNLIIEPTTGSSISPAVAAQGNSLGLTDSVNTPNITFQYKGALVNTPTSFGTFTLTSLYSSSQDKIIASKDSSTGSLAYAFGPYAVAAVPLPAAAWASFGMLGLLGVVRMRKAWR